MERSWTGIFALILSLTLTACGDIDPQSDVGPSSASRQKPITAQPSSSRVEAVAQLGKSNPWSPGIQAVADMPQILNPAEELVEFDPKGMLRWSAVAGADAYEVWAYRDAGLAQLQEFSKALVSRQYQFNELVGGQTYYIKIYFRAAGVWKEIPTFTIKTTNSVAKARLSNSQEELEGFGPSGTLRWSAVQGADVYELWVYRDAGLEAFAETSGPVRITQYQITSLTPGVTYYVQVYARVNGTYTVGGALQLTVTSQLDRARILNPQEELDAFATNGILRWSPVTGATAYELWVFTNPNSSEIYESSGSLTSRSYATRTLQPGTVYYAQAYALVNGQWQVGSPVKITTASQVTRSRLTNPQEDLEAFATNGTLRWTEVQGATAYELWIYGNAGLGTIIESGANSDRSYQPRKLCSGATYYVQVYALLNGVWTTGWATRLDVTQGTSAADCVPPAPQITLTASPFVVVSGDSVTLTWTSRFATSCTASGAWTGAKALSGRETVGPITEKSLFTLTCTGQSGAYRAETLVTVTPAGATYRDYKAHFPYRVASGRFVVASDISMAFSQVHLDHLLKVWQHFSAVYARTPGQYTEMYYTRDLNGLYSRILQACPTIVIPGGRNLTACFDNADGVYIWFVVPYTEPDFGTQLHEVGHTFLYFTQFNSANWPWFNEGISMYWESGSFSAAGTFSVERPLPYLTSNFRRVANANALVPLDTLFQMTRDQFYGDSDPARVYSQAGMVLYYLFKQYPSVAQGLIEQINSRQLATNAAVINYILQQTGLTAGQLEANVRQYALSFP